MNHYINLLESSEIHYLSAAETNPLYKLAVAGTVVLILAGFGSYFMSLKSTIREGEALKSRWTEIEKDVEVATELNQQKLRLEKAVQTLEGWSSSRHEWTGILQYLVDQTPETLETIQFTRVFFDEQMRGLRNQVPGSNPVDFHPISRVVELSLRGIIRSDRPERYFANYQRNLLSGNMEPSSVLSVNLDTFVPLPPDETGFSFTLHLAPRELLP
jgi:Tfp pilus assembly protein PilN